MTRAIRGSCIAGPIVFLVGMTLAGSPLSSTALAAAANKGLGASAALPSWAVHRHVHFLASPASADAPALQNALSRGGLTGSAEGTGQRDGTDPPTLHHEGGYGVQHTPHVYIVFWGSTWNEATGSALRAQLLKMYDGLSGSALQGILTQYFDSSGRVSPTVSVASYTDESVAAPTSLNDQKIREEVAMAIATKGWPRELDSQFVVIPAPGATYEAGFDKGFCGYHGLVEEREAGREYPYAFIPDVGDEPFYSGCIEYDEHQDANHVTSMVAAHEYAESATDPGTDTWYTEEGYEVADICSSKDTEVEHGALAGSWVQGLWDDHRNECSLSDLEPPRVYAITQEGVDVQPHEVELSGVVDPEGSETSFHFEFGPSTSYGAVVPASGANVGATVSDVSVSQGVTGLAEGIYHYRLVATNDSGTTYGKDRLAIAPGFSTRMLPEPAGSSEQHEADGVSCVAAQTCVAVGAYWNSAMQSLVPLAETFDDGEWSVQATPTPAGATESALRGVSCTAVNECSAVGYYKDSSGTQLTLAERWNGSAWALQSTPNPSGTTEGQLRGVSCFSAGECTAVGFYKGSSGGEETLAERWDGTQWAIQPTPNPSGPSGNQLMSVSCPARNVCVAVGGSYGEYPGGSRSLAERWNGSEWTTQPMGSEGGTLSGVSCTSANACTAVGTETPAGTPKTFAERWAGSGWSVQPTYQPLETSGLNAVSCTSSIQCVAVGSYWDTTSASPASEVLAERWNGTTWTQVAMDGLQRSSGTWRDSYLEAVSCTEFTACLAAGNTVTAPFGNLGYVAGFVEREFAAPSAATEAASGTTYDEAALNGAVNPQALETRYRFEYGLTTSYGDSLPVPELSVGSAVGDKEVRETVVGLQPLATYHYRLVASNTAGTTYGNDETFTTTMPPLSSSTSPPTISGSAVEGQALTETHGAWTNDPTGYAYQWQDCDWSGANCSAIEGATSQTYTLTAADVGHAVRVQETASNAGGVGGSVSSAVTTLVQAATASGGLAPGSGDGPGLGSLGSGSGGKTSGSLVASFTKVFAARPRGDLALIPLNCQGNAGSCTVMFTLTVVEHLRNGTKGVPSRSGGRYRVRSRAKFTLRVVIVGRKKVTLKNGVSEVARVALNAMGRRLLSARRALAVKLTASESGFQPSTQTVRFTLGSKRRPS